MKKLFLHFILLPLCAFLFLVSCMSESVIGLEFDSDNVLVLHSVASPQEPLQAMFTITDYVLHEMYYEKLYYNQRPYSADAVVVAYVNGSTEPIQFVTRYNPLDPESDVYRGYYETDYVPEEGDEITIEANFPGYPPIKATQKVPVKPNFVLDYDIEKVSDYKVKLTLHYTIHDAAGEDNYYRFVWPSQALYENEKHLYKREISYFSDINGFGTFDGASKTISYSTDVTIPAKEGGESLFVDIFQSISSDTYKYLESRNAISSGIFGEVVKTYSNVEGGAGIFAAVSGVRIEVPVK